MRLSVGESSIIRFIQQTLDDGDCQLKATLNIVVVTSVTVSAAPPNMECSVNVCVWVLSTK